MIAETDPAVLARAAELLIAQHGFTGNYARVMREYAAVRAESVGELARMAKTYTALSITSMDYIWRDLSRLMRAETHGWRLNLRPGTIGWENAVGVNTGRLQEMWQVERKQQRRFAQRIARALGQEVRS